MAGKSASLLTQTQRTRIQEDFDELTDDEKRRDQQRIRDRLRAGILDFHLLADYPDRQFVLAFDDVPDDEVRPALADNYLVIERLRELHGYDRAALIEEARSRTTDASAPSAAVPSLARLELQTAAEIRHQTETEVEERFGAGRWDRLASRLVKLGVGAFVPLALVVLYGLFAGNRSLFTLVTLLEPLITILFLLVYGSFLGWLFIMGAKAVKYDLLPLVMKLVRQPDELAREVFENLIRSPGKTVRESWDEL